MFISYRTPSTCKHNGIKRSIFFWAARLKIKESLLFAQWNKKTYWLMMLVNLHHPRSILLSNAPWLTAIMTWPRLVQNASNKNATIRHSGRVRRDVYCQTRRACRISSLKWLIHLKAALAREMHRFRALRGPTGICLVKIPQWLWNKGEDNLNVQSKWFRVRTKVQLRMKMLKQ